MEKNKVKTWISSSSTFELQIRPDRQTVRDGRLTSIWIPSSDCFVDVYVHWRAFVAVAYIATLLRRPWDNVHPSQIFNRRRPLKRPSAVVAARGRMRSGRIDHSTWMNNSYFWHKGSNDRRSLGQFSNFVVGLKRRELQFKFCAIQFHVSRLYAKCCPSTWPGSKTFYSLPYVVKPALKLKIQKMQIRKPRNRD